VAPVRRREQPGPPSVVDEIHLRRADHVQRQLDANVADPERLRPAFENQRRTGLIARSFDVFVVETLARQRAEITRRRRIAEGG
jgi:hypothetical protein